MFGFLKDKLKKAVKKFSTSAEEAVQEEKVEDKKEIEKAKKKEKEIVKKVAKKPVKKKEPTKVEKPVLKEEKPGFLKKIFHKKDTPEKLEEEFKKVEQMEDKKREEIDKRDRVMEAEERIIQKEADLEEELEKSEDLKEAEEEIEKEEETEDLEEALEEEAEEEEEQLEQDIEELKEIEVEIEEEKAKGFLGKLKDTFTKKSLSDEKFEELFWELEVALLENNVAVEVIEKIKEDLKHELTTGKVNRMGLEHMILHRLKESIEELFKVETFDLIKKIKKADKPFKICVIGVNGSGKTTTLAKLIHLLQKEKLTSVVAASDTFRAAAIDQLQEHTDKLKVKLISQGYKADPAAVAYDAIEHGKAQKLDVVLIDTAGRLHSNKNLMAELEKVIRVSEPDLKIFVGEAITGNDCVEQAKVFDKLVGIDAIILAKADIDEKGGAAISVSYVTGKPILYLGTGQTYDDLEKFEKEKIIEAIGL